MNFFPQETCCILPHFSFFIFCLGTHGFLPMVFLFTVKELGLLTNPSHWVRVLDGVGSYMYIVL